MQLVLGLVLLTGVFAQHRDHVGITKWYNWEKAPTTAMTLTMLTNAVQQGAMCLDGTPTGYYYAAATNPANVNDWQIYFEGGGWCYSEGDCYGRSKTALGSSTSWATSVSVGGVMSDNCTVNPDFCNFNRVYLPYCDGNSFSGNRDAAVVYNGTNLWFRGKRNMDATFAALKGLGFGNAKNVVLTGCSAGGLATYMHTDYVKTLLPASVTKYGAIPISGFFLLHNTVENKPVYPNEIQYIYGLANSSGGVNAACIAAKSTTDQWQCNFATEIYKYIANPIFSLDSNYDSWQTSCILTSEPVPANSTANGNCSAAPGWQACGQNPNNCTNDQMTLYNQYGMDFVNMMNSTTTAKKNGNGGFIYSCHTHCAGQTNSYYNTFAIGGVTMQQAVSKWWASNAAQAQWAWPCYYSATTTPRQCNPTCGST
jgi:hypothetical protein